MMERPERYDPEDIEHLMLERPFEELLPEEKAFVLHHLQDAAEYQRMRALLLHMQAESGQPEPLEAGPAVRERVLAAFRDHRQPQWRIWLNSVGGFLVPARPVHYWRPALALGALALLSITSVTLWKAMQPQENKVLAELQQPKAPSASPELRPAEVESKAAEVQPPQETAAATGLLEESAMQAATDMDQASDQQVSPAQADLGGVDTTAAPVTDLALAEAKDQPAPPPASVRATAAAGAERMAKAEGQAEAARVETTAEAERHPIAEDQLLGLLRAAW